MKKTRLLVLMTVVLALMLLGMSCAVACGFTFGDPADGKPCEVTEHSVENGTMRWEKVDADSCMRYIIAKNYTYGLTQEYSAGTMSHSFTTESKNATCVEEGYYKTYCTRCGFVATEGVYKIVDHTTSKTPRVETEPTCTTSGQKVWYCTVCNKTLGLAETIPPTHTYGDLTVVTEGNCFEPKVSQQTCTRCGYVNTVQDNSCLGQHDYSAWTQVQAPTCVQPGVEISVCKWCGKSSPSNKMRQIAPTGVHIKDTTLVVKVAPSCVAGSGYYACKYGCGTIMEDNVYIAPVAGHPVIQYRVATPETCTTDGVGESYCTTCGTVVKREKIPAGHVENNVVTDPASCCAPGHYNVVCSRCGKVLKENLGIPPTMEHELQSRLVAAATCTTGEKWEEYCPNTGMVWASYSGAPPLGHSETQVITKDAGCCTEGTYNVVCSRCNAVLETGLKIPASGKHNVKQRELTPATCTEAQVLEEYCSYTGNVLGTVTGKPAKGHSFTKAPDKLASCTEDGYYSNRCGYCGLVVENVEVMPARGHTFYKENERVTVSPFCTRNGVVTNKCIYCDETQETIIPALGHEESDNPIITKEATCTTEAVGNYICWRCRTVLRSDVVVGPAKGHTMEAYTVAATCTEDGFTGKKCSVCGYKEGTVVKAKGHTYGEWQVEREPTTTEKGMAVRYCTVCHADDYRYIPVATATPTATATATVKPTATATAAPTATATAAPTATAKPTATATAAPTATATAKPTATATAAPTATATAEPTATATAKPAATATAAPTATATAAPTKNPGEGDGQHQHKEMVIEGYPAGCETPGMTDTVFCPECGEIISKGEVIPPKGHNIVIDPAVPPTETTMGKTEGSHCEDCGKVFKPQYDVDKIGGDNGDNTGDNGNGGNTGDNGGNGGNTGDNGGNGGNTGDNGGNGGNTGDNGNGGNTGDNGNGNGGNTGDNGNGNGGNTGDNGNGNGGNTGDNGNGNGGNTGDNGNGNGGNTGDNGNGNGGNTGDNGNGNGGNTGDNGNGGSGLPNYKDGDIVDDNGNVIGRVEDDEKVFDNDGNQVGTIDGDGNIVDDTGNVIGKVDEDGNVYDEDGEHAGIIIGGIDLPGKEYKDGDIVDDDGNVIGRVDGDVVTDNDGNFVGIIDKDGNIVDGNGNVVGKVDEDANVYDENGNHVGIIIGGIDLPGSGAYMPGHPDFDLDKYLDEYYKHVEGGDVIRPGIDSDKCIIGQEITPDGSSKPVIVKGAEDYAICPVCKYPMSQWISLGNGQHIRYCTDKDCDYYEIADCPYFYITVDEVEYHVCPICGDFTERLYEFIDGVMVGGVGEMHSLYVRGLDKPFAEAAHVVKNYQDEAVVIRYSFTAVQSEKGVLNHWDKMLSVFIPVENAEGLKLVRMDREGNFEQITYMYFNGNLAFNTDCEGLYLLLSAE